MGGSGAAGDSPGRVFVAAVPESGAVARWPRGKASPGGQAGVPSIRSGKTDNGIAYDIQGSGPAVVLITGSNLDRRMWAHEASWLATTHTVVRYDLRAHG